MTLICPNEGKKMTPDHLLRIYTYMYFHPAFLQPEGCSYVIFSVFGFGARFCRARRREKRHRSHLPIQPWGKTREYKTYLDRSSHLGEIFPRSQPPPSSEARPKMTISSPYRASTASYPASFIQHLARCSSLHTATALHCLSLSTSSSLCPSFMLKKESEGKRRRPTPKGRGAERRGRERARGAGVSSSSGFGRTDGRTTSVAMAGPP